MPVQRIRARRWVMPVLGVLFGLFILLPLLMVVIEAFGSDWFGPVFLPPVWSLEWFKWAIETSHLGRVTINTVVIALLATLISVVLAFPAAWAIARRRIPVKMLLIGLILFPRMVPEITFALGVVRVFYAVHLENTYIGIALAHVLLGAPFAVLALIAAFEALDDRVLEAARVMGSSSLQIFFQVIVPLSGSALMAAALFSFIASYNDFVLTLMLYGPGTVTLPVETYLSIGNGYEPVASAISMVLLIPSLLFLLLIVNRMKPEAVLGGMKGA